MTFTPRLPSSPAHGDDQNPTHPGVITEIKGGCSFENCEVLSHTGSGCFLITDGASGGGNLGAGEMSVTFLVGASGKLCPGGSLELYFEGSGIWTCEVKGGHLRQKSHPSKGKGSEHK